MAGSIERIALKRDNNEDRFVEYTEIFNATGETQPLKFQRTDDGVHLQIAGSATTVGIVVERCTNEPTGPNPNWAPAMTEPITGDLSAGIAPFRFTEPSRAYWRVRVTALVGGNCIVVLTGEQA